MSDWRNNLIRELNDPSKWIHWSKDAVVVRDRYPKAMYHFLVMPKADIPSIFDLRRPDIGLLDRMFTMALQTLRKRSLPPSSFKIGYHAQPSLNQLHLHVISVDLYAPTMRKKKHWNSFTTSLFIPHHTLVERLKKYGHITRLNDADYHALSEGTPLKCQFCAMQHPNMDELKAHVRSHLE